MHNVVHHCTLSSSLHVKTSPASYIIIFRPSLQLLKSTYETLFILSTKHVLMYSASYSLIIMLVWNINKKIIKRKCAQFTSNLQNKYSISNSKRRRAILFFRQR